MSVKADVAEHLQHALEAARGLEDASEAHLATLEGAIHHAVAALAGPPAPEPPAVPEQAPAAEPEKPKK